VKAYNLGHTRQTGGQVAITAEAMWKGGKPNQCRDSTGISD